MSPQKLVQNLATGQLTSSHVRPILAEPKPGRRDIRADFAKLAFQAGFSDETIADALGHKKW